MEQDHYVERDYIAELREEMRAMKEENQNRINEMNERIRRLEEKNKKDKEYSIKYRVHVRDIGWMPYVREGEIAGTTGQSRRMEAIQIQLVPKT